MTDEWTPRGIHDAGNWDERDALHWLVQGIKSHALSTNKNAWEDIFACKHCRERYEWYRIVIPRAPREVDAA